MGSRHTLSALIVASALCPGTLWSVPALAYSGSVSFDIPAIAGGGGGRRFTGSVQDGYTCTVCHQQGDDIPLLIEGLPRDGYEPEREYAIRISWPERPEGLPRSSFALEWTDPLGQVSGSLAIPPLSTWPASDLCDGDQSPETTSIMMRDYGDLERQVLSSDACARIGLNMLWTAPAAGAGTVRLQATAVHANFDGTPGGDSSSETTLLLNQRGAPLPEASVLTPGCTVAGSQSYRGPASGSPLLLTLLVLLHRKRSRWGR